MKNKKMEEKLRRAFDKLTPDASKELLSVAESVGEKRERPAESRRTAVGRRRLRTALLLAAVILLIAGLTVGGVMMTRKSEEPAAGETSAASESAQPTESDPGKQTPDLPTDPASEPAVVTVSTETPTETVETPTESAETPAGQGESTPEPTPQQEPASIIYFDVNPSVEIGIDADQKVLYLRGVNADGEELLSDGAYVGLSAEQALRELAGAAVADSYLTEEKNHVLLSMEGENAGKLVVKYAGKVKTALENKQVAGEIIAQTLNVTEKLQSKADQYHISLGKAAYLVRFEGVDPDFTEKELAEMTIEELVARAKELDIPDVGSVNYSRAEALEIACARAGIPLDGCTVLCENWALKDRTSDYRFVPVWMFGLCRGDRQYACQINLTDGTVYFSREGAMPLSADQAFEIVGAYFAAREEALVSREGADSLSVYSDFSVTSYLLGETTETYAEYMIDAKTDKGIYMLKVNSLSGAVTEVDFHPWT